MACDCTDDYLCPDCRDEAADAERVDAQAEGPSPSDVWKNFRDDSFALFGGGR